MAAKEPVTTKFKVDISDLKRGITEANNTIKKANAQFNAATSGMDDWASSADGVKEKLKQLDSVLEAQKAKLSNYQQQFDRLSQAEKENAKRAEELKQKYQQAAQQFGENSKEAQQYKTALNQTEKEQQNNANAASKLEVTILNQQAAIGKTEKEVRNYNKTLEHLGKVADQTETAVNDLSGAVQDTSDGFTTLKGTIASAMGALVADKIKGFIGELKSFVLDGEESLDKFQAATGTSTEAIGEFEEQILDLYKNNYGESIDDVAESMAKVKQVTKETDPSKLQEMTKYAINLRDTFGSDFDESIRGINNLMYQFDLTTEEAFDMFAKGSQAGLDYTDELGDNVAEYSGNFKQAGYSANEYFQLLENGTSNGAYNLDKVNDAINEATNKLADGSVEKNLGIYSDSTQDLFKKWQKGGAKQKDVIDSIVDDINNCTNEQESLTMAATLFGTMGEDSNLDFIKSLTSVGDTFKDVKGTMEDVDQTRWDNTKSQMVSIGRSLMVDVVQPILNTVVPALNSFGGWFKDHVPEIISLLTGLGTTMATVFVAHKVMEMVKAYKKLKEAADVATLSQLLLNKAQFASPALMIASLIAGLAVALVTYAIATNKATNKTKEQKKAVDELTESYKGEKDAREDSLSSTEAESGAAEELADKITELAKKTHKTASEKALLKGYIDELNKIMPDLALKYDEENDKLNQNTENLYANIEAMRAEAEAKAAQELAVDAIKGRIKAQEELKKSEKTYAEAKAKLDSTQRNTGQSKLQSQEWVAAKRACDDASEAVKKNKELVNGYNEEIQSYEDTAQKSLDWSEATKNMQGFITEAKKSGVKISDGLSKGILSGKYGVLKSIKAIQDVATFDELSKKAGKGGKKAVSALTKKIESGKMSPAKAVDEMQELVKFNKLYNESGKAGKKTLTNLKDGIDSGKMLPSKAMETVVDAANNKAKAKSKEARAIGKAIDEGAAGGLGTRLINKVGNWAENALETAKKKLGIHSPSTKFRDIIGKNIISGIVAGITGSEKTLLTTMKNTMSKVLSAAKAGLGGQFAAAGSNAAELFSNAIQGKLDYLSDKVSYTFEVKMGQYDSKISSLESKLSRREKYDEKLKSLKSSKKYKNASKKERQKMIKALQKQYRDVKGHTQKYYKDYIKFYEKQQENYKTATDKALAEFNDAMSRFGSQAEQLVSDTINGITDTYQERWDNLVNLQDSMVQKLQGFGDLFTVSGAGVMTVNDIKAQTDEIKAYMERLNSMKGLVSEDLFNQIASYDVDQGKAFMDQLLSMSTEELKAYNDAYTEKMNLSKQLSESLYKSDFDKVSAEYKDAITQAFKSLPAQLEAIAKECMKGFTSGLKDDTGYLSKAIQSIANDIIKQFKDELDIHSPSKVFAALGGFSAEGYGEGFIQQMRELKSSLVASVPMQAIARASGVTNYKTNTSTVNQTFNQYNNSPKALSRLEIYRQTKNALNFAKGV